MIILGLTGSIGMGKSFTARCFEEAGAAVFDADAEVHEMLSKGGEAVLAVEKNFPGVLENGSINRKKLGSIVFADDAKRKTLEAIIHPLVRRRQHLFLMAARRMRVQLAVLDIPLLFEGGRDRECDAVAVVTAPHFVQERRVNKRGSTAKSQLSKIRRLQMSDAKKRARADFIIHTAQGRAGVMRDVRSIISTLLEHGL